MRARHLCVAIAASRWILTNLVEIAPDENALNDPALELVLPADAVLADLAPALLAPHKLPGLWNKDEIVVGAVFEYFNGKTVVQVDRGGYSESMQIPKAEQAVVEEAIASAVAEGLSGFFGSRQHPRRADSCRCIERQ